MQLYLIRHPKPVAAQGLCYGRLDVEVENPAPVAATLRTLLPAKAAIPLWSSPSLRCQGLAACLHPNPILDARLAEMDFGVWEGRPWNDIPRDQLDAWAADVANYTPPQGESPMQVQTRALAFVESLQQAQIPEAILVTHGGIIRLLCAHQQGLPPHRWHEIAPAFGSLTCLAW